MHYLIENALTENRKLLEPEILDLFTDYGIPCPPHIFVRDESELKERIGDVGYPSVMKVVSPDVVHKSDCGGVVLNICDAAAAVSAFKSINENVSSAFPNAKIEGVLVVKQIAGGTECFAGVTKDASFGHCMLFGLGGVFVELLKDISFKLIPVTAKEVKEMIAETKAGTLLNGYRGSEACDIDKVCSALMSLSRLVEDNPCISELDINPLIVCPDCVLALDARIQTQA